MCDNLSKYLHWETVLSQIGNVPHYYEKLSLEDNYNKLEM